MCACPLSMHDFIVCKNAVRRFTMELTFPWKRNTIQQQRWNVWCIQCMNIHQLMGGGSWLSALAHVESLCLVGVHQRCDLTVDDTSCLARKRFVRFLEFWCAINWHVRVYNLTNEWWDERVDTFGYIDRNDSKNLQCTSHGLFAWKYDCIILNSYYITFRHFSSRRCARCGSGISASELVMRAKDLIFHVNCFSCAICGQLLRGGDTAGIRDGRVFCGEHYDTDVLR